MNVLGLLFLWAIVFSVAGQRDTTTPAMVAWTIAGAAATVALHGLLISCEDRGWIYYRKGRGGDGRLSASAEWLNLYDPSRRHLQGAAREGEWKRDEDDDGDGAR